MIDEARAAAYLARIGITEPVSADLDGLRLLQEKHLESVPFENLDLHLGRPLSLAPDALLAKLIDQRRGGFCYELNGALSMLLSRLGFRVTLMAAGVYGKEERLGPPFDHLALRVDLDEPWLVDVGFGRFSRHPLRLNAAGGQEDPNGTFEIAPAGLGDLDVLENGKPQYRIEPKPRELRDFEAMCWYQQHSPQSHFTNSLVCTLQSGDERITLSGNTLIRTGPDGRDESTLDDSEVLAAYRDHFGIVLDRIPQVATATV